MNGIRHFLDIKDIGSHTLRGIVDLAKEVKAMQQNRTRPLHPLRPLEGRTLGLMLSKPSTRTRLSFEVGMRQLGGDVSVLSPSEMQMGRGESIADTARVLSRFVDVVVLRCGDAAQLHELADWSSVPVLNGLTSHSHPVQILADIMTFEDHRGPIEGKTVAWIGDGNNVATSWIEAAARFGFTLRLGTPESMAPNAEAITWARARGATIDVTTSPQDAVSGADCVTTDTWVSMSDTASDQRMKTLTPYRVDTALMQHAKPDALFLHCLPAHIGEEVTQDVFDSPNSVVFDEAENRLHAQKGLLLWALGGENWRALGAEAT